MAISFNKIDDNFLVLDVTGEVHPHDIVDAVKKIYESDPPSKVLWDFTQVVIKEATMFDVETIARYTKETFHSRKNAKTAIVASSKLAFGYARAYESFSKIFSQDIDVGVFHERDEAIAWLNQNEHSL